MLKRAVIFCCLLQAYSLFASTVSDENVKVYGRALANYQICSQIAKALGDKVMQSYYSEMFNDSSAEIKIYPQYLAEIIYNEFERSIDKLELIDKPAMEQLCLRRFDSLSRKMQEKKFADK